MIIETKTGEQINASIEKLDANGNPIVILDCGSLRYDGQWFLFHPDGVANCFGYGNLTDICMAIENIKYSRDKGNIRITSPIELAYEQMRATK